MDGGATNPKYAMVEKFVCSPFTGTKCEDEVHKTSARISINAKSQEGEEEEEVSNKEAEGGDAN
jgi:hypothetical protein